MRTGPGGHGCGFRVPIPLLARLTAPAGPAVPVRITRDGADVMFVPGTYSNIAVLLAPEAVVIADAGSVTDVPRVLEALAWLGRSPHEVAFVMPTHLHFDHVMGLDALALRLGVPVRLGPVAHDHVTRGAPLRFPRSLGALYHALAGWPMQGLTFAAPDLRRGFGFGFPDSRNAFTAPVGPPLADGDEVLPGWRLLATPGHADDAVCLFHEASGVLATGDTMRNFLGGEWNPLVTDEAAYAATRARLSALRVTAVLPGHGPALQGEDLVRRVRLNPPWLP